MASGRGTLTMQRLAVRLIEQRDPEDAMVLGDAMQAEGLDSLITGRSRPVLFHTTTGTAPRLLASRTYERTTTPNEQRMIDRTRMGSTFAVQGYEMIFNVGRFAAKPDEERWGRIWTMWVTPRRAMYRSLVDTRQLLPSSIRFRELRWIDVFPADVALAYELLLERVPPRRKKPIDAYLFSVVRRDEDKPRTWNQHFNEPRS